MNVRCIVVAALLAGFAGTSARAHHSVEEQYDIARLVELSGTITKVELVTADGARFDVGDSLGWRRTP